MLIFSEPTVSPQTVDTGKTFLISVSVTEEDTSWNQLKVEIDSWDSLKNNYTTWKQVKQR